MRKVLVLILSIFVICSCVIWVNAANQGDARYGHGGSAIYTMSGERLGYAYQWNNSATSAPFIVYAETDSSPNISERLIVYFNYEPEQVERYNTSYVSTSHSYDTRPTSDIKTSHVIIKTLGTQGTKELEYYWNTGN